MLGRILSFGAGTLTSFVFFNSSKKEGPQKGETTNNGFRTNILSHDVSISPQKLEIKNDDNTYSLNYGEAMSTASALLNRFVKIEENDIQGPTLNIKDRIVTIKKTVPSSEVIITESEKLKKIEVRENTEHCGTFGCKKQSVTLFQTTVPRNAQVNIPAGTKITYNKR